jgi:RNA polymerase sigma factor for flagellar operon FliA
MNGNPGAEATAPLTADALWDDYTAMPNEEKKQKLVLHYLWLVKFVIKKMTMPRNSLLTEDDFVSVGILGLSESIDRFSTERGVKFETYAITRIKGIIQDEMRKLDWMSRTARKKASDFITAHDKLTVESGQTASQREIMEQLDITPEQYRKYVAAAASAKYALTMNESAMSRNESEDSSILENMPQDDEDSFENVMEMKERNELIKEFISQQKEKPRLVLSLYYFEELTFKEIGTVLNVSESRICQIHSQVIKDLRKQITKFHYDKR